MSSTPWWAACRQCSIFVLRDFGMTILPSINTRPLSVLSRCRTSQKSRISGSVRERLWENPWLYELYIEIITSARRPNVVRCPDCICCCLDGDCLYSSIYLVQKVDTFGGRVCGAQAYQDFYCGYWVAGNCIGTFVPLAWAMLDAEGISEVFLP